MSYTFLPEQGEESLAECFSDIPACVLSRSSLIAEKSSCNGSGTESCQGSLSGMMCGHSTANLGEAESMSSAGDSHARTSVQPEREQESTESAAGYGGRWHELSVKYDRATHSWRTHLCLWDEVLPLSSVTLPKWGMMRGGVCWEQMTSEHRTDESASGYWPTPDTCAGGDGPSQLNRDSPRLATLVKHPQLWPTPQRRDWKDQASDSALIKAATGPGGQMTLPRAVVMWATPCAGDNRDRGNLGMPAIQRRMEKGKQINLSMSVSDTSGALNPDWVEWLMAWPIAWTALAPLATARFQQWLRSHGEP